MYTFIKHLRVVTVLSASALLLGACGLQLEKAENTAPPGGNFEAGLHSGYLQLSTSEYNEADYRDSDAFAGRAIASSEGSTVSPEELAARQLPGDKVGDLTNARQRLMTALDAAARTKVPAGSARAQVMFDCWMQEQEENFQLDDIQRCASGFEAAMAEVEDAMRPPPPPPEPQAEPPRPAVPEPAEVQIAPRFYTIFFDFDDDSLNDVASRVIAEILSDWTSRDGDLALVGHADSSGSDDYNLALSKLRAVSVRIALEEGGVNSGRLSDMGVGESDLAVPTADGVREPRNRRVIVTVR